jgi:cellulose synthase/poly-beta-1,6-N-acetylglucosamine synthase-like glycosyltransferase
MVMDLLLVPLAVLYLLVVSILFVFGINFFYMTYLSWTRRAAPSQRLTAPPDGRWPRVTVQLPIYNEAYVAERVILAAAALDYPTELLQIQVLDDSTDETRDLVSTLIVRLSKQGVNISHLWRKDRTGYKAGALQAGLASATGEFVAMFDADFVPPPDFLRRLLPHVREDSAFVQARWGHLNREYSLLTSLQAMAIDAHFVVEQFARSVAGLWFNFNGTAGIWRLRAMLDAGGWRADTLTEDLDLSYRALLRGWKGQFLGDMIVPAELPASITSFRRQQHRWARGSLECAIKLGRQVWRSGAPLQTRMAALLHLTGYGIHILLFILSLMYPAVLTLSANYPELLTLFGIAAIFNLTALAPTLFFLAGQREHGRSWWRSLPKVLLVSAVGSGLMINTVRAAMQIVTVKKPVFERTAKFGLAHKGRSWTRKRYRIRFDTIVLWEIAFALMNFATAVAAFQARNWAIAFYASLFAIGLSYVGGLSIAQELAGRLDRRARETSLADLRLQSGGVKGGD